ncbi:MAG TPA: NUDIX domain-containing protein [Candidatus Bathyarchaeia archaeon]|nr:NUDIX domain-containing protein [Candidatus Bathyarchaeia archaeon]
MKNKFPRSVEVVGSAIIENEEGQILLTQSPKWSNKWTMPGGHIDPGEKVSEGITREVEEEVGLKVKFIDVIVWGELIDSKDFHRPAHFIYFDVYYRLAGEKVKLDGVEIKAYKWLTPKEALSLNLAESYSDTIQKFIEYKKNRK